jgi:Kef-type K+ transport system membrane component KefB
MVDNSIVFSIFLIFTGAAVLSTFALMTKQSLIVAYIVLGVLLGPWGFKLVNDSYVIQQTGDIGIIFLLFLLGLHLDPKTFYICLKKQLGLL